MKKIHQTSDLRAPTPPGIESTTTNESIEIRVKVIQQPGVSIDVAIKTVADRIRSRSFDSQRAAVVRESAIAISLTRESFARNYGLADLARKHVRLMLVQGSNAVPDAKLNLEEAKSRSRALRREVDRVLKELVLNDAIEWKWDEHPWNGKKVQSIKHLDGIYVVAEMLQDWGYGHCGEQSAAAYCLLMQNETIRNSGCAVEVYRLEGGDHQMVVIGRKSGSDPNDMGTWGSDAIVCDPWANKVYPCRTSMRCDYLRTM
jgi:hypothetical protein